MTKDQEDFLSEMDDFIREARRKRVEAAARFDRAKAEFMKSRVNDGTPEVVKNGP